MGYTCLYMAQMTLSEELKWRGFLHQTTFSKLTELDKRSRVFYHGFDASADSLTVGNLAALMMDKCFIRHGYKAIILAGGATSLIGDPGGKDKERPLQSEETVKQNVASVSTQLEQLLGNSVQVVNNLEWFKHMNVLTYLRDVGKHFSMTPLVQRDYIATRMGKGGSGISYTELSYTLLQGYDYLYLYEKHGVELQLCGSDQWGNSLSGVELVRRTHGKDVHIVSCPLILDVTTGKKFGKSEDGAIWLDSQKTSVYSFYQFWLNIADDSVEQYLKIFTMLDKPAIDHVMDTFKHHKAERSAQKTLAYEVTKLVHGVDKAESVKRVSEVLFGGTSYDHLHKSDFELLKAELPTQKAVGSAKLVDVLVGGGLAASNSEARRFLMDNAVYVNGEQIPLSKETIDKSDSLHGFVLVRRGKNTQTLVELKRA